MKKDNCSSRLKKALSIRGMRQIELCELTGIPKSAISQYLHGSFEPKQDRVWLLAKALNVSEAWLMGYDVPMNDAANETHSFSENYHFSNIFPIEKKRFPLLGSIACGVPIYADEDKESYIIAGTNIKADFCLRAQGDSMINARIMDGDIVFIRSQPMVDDGEIAAVVIDDEATLKRVYYDTENQIVQLVAENPAYRPIIYQGEELESIHVIGKAVAFQSDI